MMAPLVFIQSQLLQKAKVPKSDALLDIRQTAEEQKRQLLSNKDIPPERVEVALQAIQAETEQAARVALGEQAFGQYLQTAKWLQNPGTN